MTTTFETAKVGDRVFSHTFGWGEIREVSEDSQNVYYIHVYFENHGFEHYTLDGYFHNISHIQSLFWDECTIEAPTKPLPIKLVHGVEVPDISFHPTNQTGYYYPYPTGEDLVYFTVYDDVYSVDKFRSANNLCYPNTEEGKQAAILHAKAMLGIPV
jgi:hypothetical protein